MALAPTLSPDPEPNPNPSPNPHFKQESLAVAEQRLSRGVEQLATDRQQLPSQIFGAADRLQGIMDEMQQDQSAGAQRQVRYP